MAPYPLLVSIGMEADGALVLVNLEEVHVATIAGAPDKAAALGRHVAAELALNPWSALVDVDTVGIGRELADIDPSRLHHHAVDDTAFFDQLAVDPEIEDPSMEPDQFRALIALSNVEAVEKVATIITGHEGRSGAALLVIGADTALGDVSLVISATGVLAVESLDLRLTAVGLSMDGPQQPRLLSTSRVTPRSRLCQRTRRRMCRCGWRSPGRAKPSLGRLMPGGRAITVARGRGRVRVPRSDGDRRRATTRPNRDQRDRAASVRG